MQGKNELCEKYELEDNNDLQELNVKLRKEIIELKIALQEISRTMQYFQDETSNVYESFSYKFGHRVTKFFRWIYRKLSGR